MTAIKILIEMNQRSAVASPVTKSQIPSGARTAYPMITGISSLQFTSRLAPQTKVSVGIASMMVIIINAICGPKKAAVEGPIIMPDPNPENPRIMPVIKTTAIMISIGVWDKYVKASSKML